MHRRFLAFAVLLLLPTGCLHRTRDGETVYRGRTVSEWLNEAAAADYDRRLRAERALRRIGTNAVPVYLALIATNAPKGEAAMIAHEIGIGGFEILHTNAAPFVPELSRLASNGHPAAVAAFGAIGVPALPALLSAFDSTNSDVRRDALAATIFFKIRQDEDSLRQLMRRVLLLLADPAPEVRFAAARVAGAISTNPQTSVPALQRLTNDPHPRVRREAIGALARFGTNALPAFEHIAARIADEDEAVRRAVTNALYRIDWRRAADFGVRAPVH